MFIHKKGQILTLSKSVWVDGKPVRKHIANLGKSEREAKKSLKILLKDGGIEQSEFDKLAARFDTDIWGSPQFFLQRVRVVFGGFIALDPCTQASNPTGALNFFTEKEDGLIQEWAASNLYLNPPYSFPKPWLAKLVEAYQAGQIRQAIALVKAGVVQNKRTRDYVTTATRKALWRGRLKFESLRDGRATKSPDFDVAVLYWGDRPELFEEQFREYCAEMW